MSNCVVCEYFWDEGKEWCEVVAHHHSKVAAEERRQAIEEMLSLVDCHSTFGDVMGALYDAGYRKNGGEEMSNCVVRDSQMFRMPPSVTLRDRFAMTVMHGIMANPNGARWCSCSPDDVASLVYSMADAMLKEREK